MDYARIYMALCTKARERKLESYSERHHIVPKCMGGTNRLHNIVRLTAEEHFVAHQLLVKLNPDSRGLIFALQALSMKRNGRVNNKTFGWIRRKLAEETSRRRKGAKQPPHVGAAVSARHKGRKQSPELIAKRSAALKGRKLSEEHRAQIRARMLGTPGTRRGAKVTEETRARMREAALKRVQTKEATERTRAAIYRQTPEQRSARAHKAWETKRRKAAELAANISTTED